MAIVHCSIALRCCKPVQRLDLVDEYPLRGPPRGGRARSVLVFRPAAIIAPEVRGRDTAQIGHRGVALSPVLAALSTSYGKRIADVRFTPKSGH